MSVSATRRATPRTEVRLSSRVKSDERETAFVVLRDISQTAQSLLGQNLYDKLKRLMGRRGIRVEE